VASGDDTQPDVRAAADRVLAWLNARPNDGREDGTEQPIVATLRVDRGFLHLHTADLRALAEAGAPAQPDDAELHYRGGYENGRVVASGLPRPAVDQAVKDALDRAVQLSAQHEFVLGQLAGYKAAARAALGGAADTAPGGPGGA
jgi:hypothetical protein